MRAPRSTRPNSPKVYRLHALSRSIDRMGVEITSPRILVSPSPILFVEMIVASATAAAMRKMMAPAFIRVALMWNRGKLLDNRAIVSSRRDIFLKGRESIVHGLTEKRFLTACGLFSSDPQSTNGQSSSLGFSKAPCRVACLSHEAATVHYFLTVRLKPKKSHLSLAKPNDTKPHGHPMVFKHLNVTPGKGNHGLQMKKSS